MKARTTIECSEEWYRRVIHVVQDAEITLEFQILRLKELESVLTSQHAQQVYLARVELQRVLQLVIYNKIPF